MMRAMAMTALGGPEVLSAMDLPVPVPGEKDLLIKVKVCGLNPVDTKIRHGMRMKGSLPCVLGFDVAGVVEGMGKEVTGFGVGEEVYASPSLARAGVNAEYVCVDYRLVAKKPRNMSYEEAAAVPLAVLTAWEAMHEKLRLECGETILIHAGAGGVGHLAIQLAKLRGCRVITTAGREESKAFCQRLGADVVIDYKKEDFVERIMKETNGQGLAAVFDTVGGETGIKSIDCVGLLGRMVTILPMESSAVGKLFLKSASLHFEFMGVPGVHGIGAERHGRILQIVAAMIEAEKIKVHLHRVMKLEELAKAHQEQEAGHVQGKIVLQV